MHGLRSVVVLALIPAVCLVASGARAQAPVGDGAAGRGVGPASESPPPRRVLRIPANLVVGGGLLTATVWGLTAATCGESSGDVPICPIFMVPITYLVGSAALAPLVYGLGTLMDGDGGLGWTYLGTGIGTAAGALLVIGMAVAELDDSALLFAIAGLLPPVVGTIIGYEASSTESRAFTERRTGGAGARLSPVLAPTAHGRGATLGLLGAF